jgi:hypothetical protein
MKKFATIAQFITFCLAVYATLAFVNEKLVITAIVFWLSYAVVCLGLATTKEVQQFRIK